MGYSDTMEILGARKSEPKWEIERQMTRGGRRVVCVCERERGRARSAERCREDERNGERNAERVCERDV
jgi:hypothetical protein